MILYRLCPILPGVATIVAGDFEWEDAKAAANLEKHGVTFEEATTVFDDPGAVELADPIESRIDTIGFSGAARLLFVVSTETVGERIRIISARRATPVERALYNEEPHP